MAKNEITKQTQKQGITAYLSGDAVKANIAQVVGANNSTRFISSVVSAVQANPELSKCSNSSILSAALLGQSLELTPSPQLGQYYIVPYKTEAQFQLGYKGYIQLAVRSGQYRKIVASEVKDGEITSYNPITEDFTIIPITDMKKREKAKTVGYYAMFELVNGFRKELYWAKEQMESHAKRYSQGYRSDLKKGNDYSFWSKDFDGMAKKTLLRQLISKWGIMSVDMQKAFSSDMAVLDESGNPTYVDNVVDVVEESKEEVAENANTEEFIVESDAQEIVDPPVEMPEQAEMDFD